MQKVNDAIAALPMWVAVLFLVIVVFFRSQGTYWLARLGTEWVEKHTAHQQLRWRKALHDWVTGASVQQGVGAVEKWGIIIVPLSFCTWGFQTLVQAGAGAIRLHWGKYTMAAIPGYFAWAIIYYTVGIAALRTVGSAWNGNTWAMLVMTLIVGLLFVYIVWKRTRAVRSSLQGKESKKQ